MPTDIEFDDKVTFYGVVDFEAFLNGNEARSFVILYDEEADRCLNSRDLEGYLFASALNAYNFSWSFLTPKDIAKNHYDNITVFKVEEGGYLRRYDTSEIIELAEFSMV